MQLKILGIAALALAAVLTFSFSTANSINAATAELDSRLNRRSERATQARRMCASGCSRERKCVAGEKGAPGTFVGKCKQFAMQWSCPIRVN